ncbi:hypothetical protein [Sulfurimonas sp. HSL-1716]|uniref:hypothetical protein n=1 Tax=Hydrocurvibacter sulfurireducens TaxID=3131937 RepID=UPI0031F72E15
MKYILTLITVFLLCTSLNASPLNGSNEDGTSQYMDRASMLGLLENVSSPFEDMTQYALADNDNGLQNSIKDIQNKIEDLTFNDSFPLANYIVFRVKLDRLKNYIHAKDYKKTALLSAEIFHDNIKNFKYSRSVKEQIIVEDLDYMGVKTLALLNQDRVDYAQLYALKAETKQLWKQLKSKIKDTHIVDSFDSMFQGLDASTEKKDIKNAMTYASLDLALVDMLEKQFQE